MAVRCLRHTSYEKILRRSNASGESNSSLLLLSGVNGTWLFSDMHIERMRGNSHRLQQGKFEPE